MSVFTEAELAFLRSERMLARIATVGRDGMPHLAAVGWSLADGDTAVKVGGINFAATKKFRDVARTGKAAIIIDVVEAPWRPRGVEVRGAAEAVDGPEPHILIRPTRIVSWGFDGAGAHDV